jgi:flagellar motility protein MotE (MotC chaperone)
VLDRTAGELAWGAQVCAEIEDALSDLIRSSADLSPAEAARLQRLDELRQTLEDLGRLQQQLAHLAEGREGVRMAVESAIRQDALRRRLNAMDLAKTSGDSTSQAHEGTGTITWL